MSEILLTTLNARYPHSAFGLRYLMANLGDLAMRAEILEFDISQRPFDIVEAILARGPRIVGMGIYIWNATEAARVVADLKRIRPDLLIVLGGPEISYETDQQPIAALADYVITGEADLAFAALCRQLLDGRKPLLKIIPADLPEFSGPSAAIENLGIQLPYDLYDDRDIAHRVIYVEASRGCPFKCEFCLSSLDVPVRNVPLEGFLAAMGRLLDRGVRQFKFVDRTFNLNLNISRSILEFFRERYFEGLFLHFEMIPDRLPEALRASIAQFPPGALQFEVGIQTFNPEVAARISRRQDYARLAGNLTFLRQETGVHVHADLIVGLPGEDVESFGRGFDQLIALGPQEVQVGLLKRLRGTPIVRHDQEWRMVYSPNPPYEVLQTGAIDFPTMQRMRRFARYWDLIANSGHFLESTPFIWRDQPSPFHAFLAFSDWLYERSARSTHGIALQRLATMLFEYISTNGNAAPAAMPLWHDLQRGGRRDCPEFLRPFIAPEDRHPARAAAPSLPSRQARHLVATPESSTFGETT